MSTPSMFHGQPSPPESPEPAPEIPVSEPESADENDADSDTENSNVGPDLIITFCEESPHGGLDLGFQIGNGVSESIETMLGLALSRRVMTYRTSPGPFNSEDEERQFASFARHLSEENAGILLTDPQTVFDGDWLNLWDRREEPLSQEEENEAVRLELDIRV
jgi:hypothetical protein